MLLCWLVVRVHTSERPGAVAFGALGLAWGLACVVRPSALLLALPLAHAWWTCGRTSVGAAEASPPGAATRARSARSLAALALGAALAIVPLTLRNLAATGELVLLSPGGGMNLYLGNAPGATGTFRSPTELPDSGGPRDQVAAFHAAAERALGRTLGAREVDAYWMRHTLALVARDLPGFARLMLHKLHLFWNGRELHNVYDYEFTRMLSAVLGLPLVQFAWVAPFALAGGLLLLVRSRVERAIALYLFTAMAAVVLVFVTDRYRLPVVGPALVAAAGLVPIVRQAWAARAWPRLAALAALVAVGVALAVPIRVDKRFERKYYGLGHAWLEQGRLDRAQWALERSLAAEAGFLPSLEALARVHVQTGDTRRARVQIDAWEREARARRDFAALERAARLRRSLEPSG
jgi:hypothetical protein